MSHKVGVKVLTCQAGGLAQDGALKWGRYFKEESDTQRLAERVLQRNLTQRSFSISKMDLEDNYVDALDPEKLVQCPYDRCHQIRACRFPYHLIKCRKVGQDVKVSNALGKSYFCKC